MKTGVNNYLTVIARWIAVLLAAFFVVTALSSLILFNIDRRAFNAGTYSQALISEGFYKQFPILLSDLLAKNITGNAPAFLEHMSANQWRVLVESLLPKQQMQLMTEDTLNQVFAYINGGKQRPNISLIPLKNSLAGPGGMDAVLTIIQSQPDCTLSQIERMLNTFGQELCNPPQQILDLLHPVIQIELQSAASAFPDSISIFDASNNPSVEADRKDLKGIRLLMRFSPLIPITLLFVITIVAVRTFTGWLAWWGWPFFLTGLFGFTIGFTGAPLSRWLIERWLTNRFNLTLTPEITAAIQGVLEEALRQILKTVAWGSLVLFIIGLTMILFAAFLMMREKKKIASSEADTQII